MKTNKYNLKNFFIILLSISALYFTVQLWFEKLSNRNFFYLENSNTYEYSTKNFSTPYRIINNNEDSKKYFIKYNNLDNSIEMRVFNKVFSGPKNFKFKESGKIDWENIYTQRSYVYQYNFEMSRELFLESNNLPQNSFPEVKGKFTSIMISSAKMPYETFKIIFFNGIEEVYYEYEIEKPKDLEIITDSNTNMSNFIYESSKQLQFNIISKNVYLPTWFDNYYVPISVSNPYFDTKDEEVQSNIDDKIYNFFENPSAKISSLTEINGDTVFVYSDGANKSVRYTKGKYTLEYNDSTFYDNEKETSVDFDFKVASSFILEDLKSAQKSQTLGNATNEFYLADFKEVDGLRTFYFDYAINDFQILMSTELKKTIGMNYHIEVTVERGNVINYKKATFYYSDSVNYEMVKLSQTYIDIIDSIFESMPNNDESIDDIQFVYYNEINKIDKSYNNILFYWIVKLENGVFSKAA